MLFLGSHRNIKLDFWYVKTHCSTLQMKAPDSSKILLPTYEIIQQHIPENSNPVWCHLRVGRPTPHNALVVVHSLRSAGPRLSVKYRSICIAQYIGTWWGGRGEPLTVWKFYSTLVWSSTYTSLHLVAMIVLQNIQLVSYDLYHSWKSDML